MSKNILLKFLIVSSVVGLAGAEVSCQTARVAESGHEDRRALPAQSPKVAVLATSPLPVIKVSPPHPINMAQVAQLFANPPASARPWVYWTWIDGNLTREGITADLEAMKRVGIGGALILDVSQGMPAGQGRFLDARWQSMFKYTVGEAKRLGLQINMNNGAGYYGSGGSWVPPEKSMQWVYSSETHIAGGTPWTGQLPRPKPNKEYRDIAVLAVAENAKSKFQIPDFTMKSLQWREWVAYKGAQSAPLDATAPAEAVIPLQGVVDITDKMAPDGSLSWNAPPGNWTLIRFGHASTGREVGPSRPGEAGLETDKLDKSATQLHFDAFVKRLNAIVGPDAKNTLVSTHIDSWEGGGQNWTGAMRDEFKKRRGYDPIPYLPILTGRVVGNLQITERFLYDLRETVSELMQENYSAEFQRLAHANGLRNSFESYTTIGNDLDNANYTDEPMAEFWTPNGQGLDFQPTVKSMSSAAHLNGHSIVGAESFTSGGQEKWLWHPAMFKSIGDRALAGGVNRFVFHRYAAQPFRPEVKPGMQMGPWGLHYERTNTWWEYSGPWHRYLARCQYLLRQGKAAADVLKLESEEPLHRFQNISLAGYDYDACGPQTLLRAGVVEGKVVFPSGASYRLLVLPDTPTMSIKLLGRIRDLVRAGAAIVGNPPQRTPGLTDYPQADATLQKLVAEIWGSNGAVEERTLGKGRVFRGINPEEALYRLRVTPAFTCDHKLNWIQRSVGDSEVFFVANPVNYPINARCLFRVAGKQPEMWWGESGQRELVPVYRSVGNSTEIPLRLNPSESVFIVFRKATPAAHAISVSKDGQPIIPTPGQGQKIEIVSATYGVPGDLSRSRDARDRVEQLVAEGTLAFPVSTITQDGDPAFGVVKTLTVTYKMGGRTESVSATDGGTLSLAKLRAQNFAQKLQIQSATYGIPGDAARSRDATERVRQLVSEGTLKVPVSAVSRDGSDPAFGVLKMLTVKYTLNGHPQTASAVENGEVSFTNMLAEDAPPATLRVGAGGAFTLETSAPGNYVIKLASGKQLAVSIKAASVSTPVELKGPWDVNFEPGRGAPAKATFDRLISWHLHPDAGIRYFSGTGTYSKPFSLSAAQVASNRQLWLDLGQVQVMARVKLNGQDLGILWKPPYRVNISGVAKAGMNNLQVKVVNLWVNRLIGDEQLPEDSERFGDGRVKTWPQWLLEGQPSPTGRLTFSSWRLWNRQDPLQESGLLGPVTLRTVQLVRP